MQETIAKESPRRIGRRLAAAGMALVAALGLGACKATGGGYVGAPLDGGVIGDYSGDANFGFNFTCEVDMAKKRTVIKGEITYHDDPSNVESRRLPGDQAARNCEGHRVLGPDRVRGRGRGVVRGRPDGWDAVRRYSDGRIRGHLPTAGYRRDASRRGKHAAGHVHGSGGRPG